MKWMRWTAAVVVGMLLATGLVRAAGTQFGALRNKARRALESSGAKKDVPVNGDDATATPRIVLASIAELSPAAQAHISATGNWNPATRFSLAGRGFSLSDPTVAQGTFEATVAADATVLPSTALLRATNRRGTGQAVAAFVGGRWQIAGTGDNGWRVRMTPVAPKKPGTLAFRAEFFDGAAKTPFTTRDADITLEAQEGESATYQVTIHPPSLSAVGADAECDPIMARAHELADKLMKAKTPAEEDRVSAEIDEIQDKIDTCVERQQENVGKIAEQAKAIEAQSRLDSQKFGCTALELTVAPGGAAQGSFSCATGTPSFTGTMTRVP